jgi:hypothetical protein
LRAIGHTEIKAAFGWWEFGLEMGLARKKGDGVGQAKTNASAGIVI